MAYNEQTKGIVFDIIKYAIHDGPGIRTTVFLKGCPLACWWCQNPESKHPQSEKVFDTSLRKYSNLFYDKDKNIIGRRVTAKQVMTEVEKDSVFYKYSGGGVTFSGGEPLMQPDFLLALLKVSKRLKIHTALDTSGYAPWLVFKQVLDYLDLFLYDLKLMDSDEHREYTGEDNTVILENIEKLAYNKANIIVRIPVITGITDRHKNIRAIGEFLRTIRGIELVDLLPYNYLCKDKYKRMKRDYSLKHIDPPTERRLSELKGTLETYGLSVKVGRSL
jgi:pyruvate formate lyase activating enzyme